MKCSYPLFLSSILGGGAFAANSKLNQYASISDWYVDETCFGQFNYWWSHSEADVNIISHASPPEESCHSVDSRTGALYLVTGSGAAGAVFWGMVEPVAPISNSDDV